MGTPRLLVSFCAVALAACGGASGSAASGATSTPQASSRPQTQRCAPAASSAPASPGPSPAAASGLTVPSPFTIQIVAKVPGARELAFLPNGDLLAGSESGSLYIVQNAEGAPAAPRVFAKLGDAPAAGVAFTQQGCSIYAGTQHAVYRIPYAVGDSQARSAPEKIASVRAGSPAPGSDGDVHRTTSVAVLGETLYVSVGSSCNACTEIDPTRASVQQMGLDGSAMSTKAKRIRNGMALAVNPQTNTLWVGGAGQDNLPTGHPYEFFDPLTLHAGVADYGWPECEENHVAYTPGAACASTIAPRVEFLAYETIVGAAFYPANASGPYAFPARYRGGAFVTMHGSWHRPNGCPIPPRVAFVPMNGDSPATSVDWSDPTKQWSHFLSGFQPNCDTRIGRPAGIAVGPQGDLFISDDQTGNIYRIRP